LAERRRRPRSRTNFLRIELRDASQSKLIGLTLSFLVIDMLLTMSMCMMMLPPTAISLPVKILFFVLIDGWNLLVGNLIKSFL
jgi:flagellar biosynthesis protein FliP